MTLEALNENVGKVYATALKNAIYLFNAAEPAMLDAAVQYTRTGDAALKDAFTMADAVRTDAAAQMRFVITKYGKHPTVAKVVQELGTKIPAELLPSDQQPPA